MLLIFHPLYTKYLCLCRYSFSQKSCHLPRSEKVEHVQKRCSSAFATKCIPHTINLVMGPSPYPVIIILFLETLAY